MKVIKVTTLLLICVSILLAGTACEDFLTKSDPTNFNMDNYFTQPAHAEGIVNATYQSLYSIQDNQSWTWLITELRTGAVISNFGGAGGVPNFQIVSNLDISADYPSIESVWESHYRGIANANVAINKITQIQMDEAQKKRLLGEARFLRAYYYFNLVRIFGGVPLIKESVDLNSPGLNSSRASVFAIYELIIEDLTTAEDAGLSFNDNSGRVTLGAVKSLLSDVYLTMAGYPLQMGSDYYELARDKAKEVIDSQEYSLFGSYDAFRDPNRDNTIEHIFSVQFHELERPYDRLQRGLLPFKLGISEYSGEQGNYYAQSEFVESYETEDKRSEEGQFFYTKYTLEENRSDTIHFGNHFNFKFFNEDAHLNTARSGLNWQIIRYADVLLDYAEASNAVSGPTSEAYEAVNKIRRRANIPELSGLNQSEFREAIWQERWHELVFEGEIWFDMVRTRKAYNYVEGEFNDYVGHTFENGNTLAERDLLFPLPTSEIRNNPNLQQNPGY